MNEVIRDESAQCECLLIQISYCLRFIQATELISASIFFFHYFDLITKVFFTHLLKIIFMCLVW